MNSKEYIVFMFKVHHPHVQATVNCAISLTITSHSNFNFSNLGGWGVHLQVDWKSVRFTDSDWLSTLPRADSCARMEDNENRSDRPNIT